MAVRASPWLGKLAYGVLFVLVAPVGLWLWGSLLSCPLPAIQSRSLGVSLFLTGAFLMVLAMWRLWKIGGGLPMNAFPPLRVVTSGVYGLLPHPIYFGFVLCCAGMAIGSGSASGLWMVTPIAALACFSLVLGYEGPSLQNRFGSTRPKPWIGLPSGEGFLSMLSRVGAALAVLGPWAICYLAVKAMGVAGDASETRLAWEWNVPVLPQTMPLYASIYLVVPLTFLLCADRARMRRLAISGWTATALNTLIYLTVPATAAFRSVAPDNWLSHWLAWEQQMALPAAGSLPSFHVTWAVISAYYLSRGSLHRVRVLCWLWLAGLCASCLTTGMHSVADVLAGAATGAICVRAGELWRWMLRGVERLGNSWDAWQLGPLRIINHALWSGLAGFSVLFLAGISAGPNNFGWLFVVAIIALMGAGLFAQWVEGSSALLRPFGYYGSILGGLLGLSIVALVHGPAVDIMAALALAAPWAMAIGRLRCVVQGCCHGRPVAWGIHITNPHSRVVKLGGFSGQPIHPTPLYSIVANVVLGIILLRMRVAGASPFLIAGLYLSLGGMSRFVEEAYRGEPQTARAAGLALYQWLAIASVLLGMMLMAVHAPASAPLHAPTPVILLGSLVWGAVSAFAMSMDFPDSRRRFSRLTG